MTFGEISQWLKSSIPGLIILSAAGSVGATIVLRAAARALSELKARRAKSHFLRTRESYAHGFALGSLRKRPSSVTIYFAYHIVLFMAAMTGLLVGAVAASITVPVAVEGSPFSWAFYLALVVTFTSATWAARVAKIVIMAYEYDISPLLRKARELYDVESPAERESELEKELESRETPRAGSTAAKLPP